MPKGRFRRGRALPNHQFGAEDDGPVLWSVRLELLGQQLDGRVPQGFGGLADGGGAAHKGEPTAAGVQQVPGSEVTAGVVVH